jgi:hypothetical protein
MMSPMSVLSDKFSFEQWVDYVFDRPVEVPEWWWPIQFENEWPGDSPETLIEYMTRLFEAPEFLLQRFSRSQVGQGLWYISSTTCSDYSNALMSNGVSDSQRRRFSESIYTLFAHLFAPHCTGKLGYLGKAGDPEDHLNSACYMWWDNFWYGRNNATNFRDCIVAVMEKTLSLPSELCMEAALHGLGHQARHMPEEVQQIVDQFLTENPEISPELRAYAARARAGCVQ